LIVLIIFGEKYSSGDHHYTDSPTPVTSFHFSPNILLSTLFSNTLRLWTSLNLRDKVSHPYKTTGKIIVLYILTFIFLLAADENIKGSGQSSSRNDNRLVNIFIHSYIYAKGVSPAFV
jgi:hypothetical protein